ncbi:hypothetical protein PVNG_05355 [Plasmodium vivax North Korean]|uniref:Uncharacterized protein n=1 Tax=Plasmodium vivax North Korean TaxID=1035514 RepID=A0A0J9TYX0_PLAVI|nr:hypothetical protein PVNG_05355 [Plasmodium vivax North Korean]
MEKYVNFHIIIFMKMILIKLNEFLIIQKITITIYYSLLNIIHHAVVIIKVILIHMSTLIRSYVKNVHQKNNQLAIVKNFIIIFLVRMKSFYPHGSVIYMKMIQEIMI